MASLRIENNLSAGTARNFCFDINNGASSKCIPPGGSFEQITSFEVDFPSIFNLTGNITPDHVISYECRDCTHSLEIINTPNNDPMKVRAVPVFPFLASIDPNVHNIVKAHQTSTPPTLSSPENRKIPDGIFFLNTLGIQVKIKIVLNIGTIDLTLEKFKVMGNDHFKEYKNNSLDANWFAAFQIIEAICPHNSTCSRYAYCKYVNPTNKYCFYHLIINSKCYQINMRVDDRLDIHPVFQFIGRPPAPNNINITIVPD